MKISNVKKIAFLNELLEAKRHSLLSSIEYYEDKIKALDELGEPDTTYYDEALADHKQALKTLDEFVETANITFEK